MNPLSQPVPSFSQSQTDSLQAANTAQRAASDPNVSVWVNASAGSGKTKVLTDRMLRLLLPHGSEINGTPPERILALTYTKAGASEMIARLHRDLSLWAAMDEKELGAHLEKNLLGRTPTSDEVKAARQLFARVLDTPGGLKIMTIHSFCQSVLARFPIEAGISPNSTAMEEDEAKQILERARKEVIKTITPDGIDPLSESVRLLGDVYPSPTEHEKFLKECLANRGVFEQQLKRHFGVDGLYTALCASLHIRPNETEEDITIRFCTNPLRLEIIDALVPVLKTNKKYNDTIETLNSFKNAPIEDRAKLYDNYKYCFLTKKHTPLKAIVTSISTYEGMADGRLGSLFDSEVQRLLELESQFVLIRQARATRALFHLVASILERYEILKHRLGRLDYDDMIIKTLNLLRGQTEILKHCTHQKVSPQSWVLYKLDGGIDHLLIDEAQDTSPLQWEILKTIGEEFFSGQSAKETERTVFVVGDEKQSIYSFQGAQPEKFEEMRFWFEQKLSAIQKTLQKIDLTISFRSTGPILALVDEAFSDRNNLGTAFLNHTVNRIGQGGHVELWPLIHTESDTKDDKVYFLDKHHGPIKKDYDPSYLMAKKIGDMIKSWIDHKEILQGYDRPIEPQDILILVRTRKTFARQMIRVLKQNGIAVSGSDLMVLLDQMVAQDLCIAARFALLPEDDLTLACLLKSPWVGITEEALFDLCHARTESLWKHIQKNGDGIFDWLNSLLKLAKEGTPHDFFNFLIYKPCPSNNQSGLEAIKTRLGDDALDPLDEFLSLSLQFSKNESGQGLEGFLDFIEREAITIKRQLENAKDSVRVMTVHGSKGLQAPIVFLPDTVFPPHGLRGNRILWPREDSQREIPPLIMPSKDDMPESLQTMVDERVALRLEEYNRLLYVAMTRAEERLYVGGFSNKVLSDKQDESSWYSLIEAGFKRLSEHAAVEITPTDTRHHYVWTQNRTVPADKKPDRLDDSNPQEITYPDYLHAPIRQEYTPYTILKPSSQDRLETESIQKQSTKDINIGFNRGIVLHRLLQFLPNLSQDEWEKATRAYLEKTLGQDINPAEVQILTKEVLAILHNPIFARIFGEGSLAEVPITGMIDEKTMISGQIDRLFIAENEIFILDYKTNRNPPETPRDIPASYKQQMAAYCRALRIAYPDKVIRSALLWTQKPCLIELSDL
jgi:ATP-dependent helicase/nuclease subunit A